MSTTTPTFPNRLASTQPWLQDQYAAVRANVAPRLEQTRAVVVPALGAAGDKVRDEVLSKTADLLSRAATQAADRSAPLRTEMSARTAGAVAALRGQMPLDLAAAAPRRRKRKLMFVAAAAAAGAAAGVAAVLWQRGRERAWVEEDEVRETLEPPTTTDGVGYEASVEDDPADPDGGAESIQDGHPAHHADK